MKLYLKYFNICTAGIFLMTNSFAQKKEMIQVLKETNANRINILVNQQPFTSFIYPDSLE